MQRPKGLTTATLTLRSAAIIGPLAFAALGCGGATDAEPASRPQLPLASCAPAARPSAVPALPAGEATTTQWGTGTGTTPDLVIDVAACASARYFAWLPLGSAWVRVERVGSACALWLGGETENPMYAGGAAQYCELALACPTTVTVHATQGGPAHLDDPGCTP